MSSKSLTEIHAVLLAFWLALAECGHLRRWSNHFFHAITKGIAMQPFRSILSSVCATLGLCAATAFGVWEYLRMPDSRIVFGSTGPTVEQLQELSELVSLQVTINDILTAESDGYFGYRGSWIIKGDSLYSTDLAQAEIVESRGPGTQSLWRITLPPPAIKWARVDHDRSRVFDLRRKTWLPWDTATPDRMRDEVMRQGQRIVLQSSMKPEYLQRAKIRAEQTLRSFYAGKGTNIEVVWRNEPTNSNHSETTFTPEVAQR